MAFLRNLLATLVGLIIFFVLIIMIVSGIAASADVVPEVKNNSVLSINLSGVLVERAVENPFAELFGKQPPQLGLTDILSSIKAAKTDDRIKGIYINPTHVQAGQASLLEIRNALLDFKENGKFIYAYGEYISEGDYLVVSSADSLFLNPEGSLELNGISLGVTFFKGLFDKLDIEPEIFRVGEYKSYVEPFIRKSMSEENRLQLSALGNSIYDTYLSTVSENNGVDTQELKNVSNEMLVREPEDAMRLGLISKVAYEDEIMACIQDKVDVKERDDINFISFRKYAKANIDEYASGKIAVIVANGDIIMGGDDEAVGGEQFAKEIRKARENNSVKAIVLRVNSPGGSLTASELIWRELMLTKGVKPLIASMSNVAASGGYYISSPCDTIIAQPNTITGSIGIFGLMFNFGEFMENKLGITTEVVKTGKFSDIWTVTRSLTPAERTIIQTQVERGYDTFVTRVAEGRNMTIDEVKAVAGGRVWTGVQAHERGLVDMLGSYEDAVELAAKKAGLEEYRVVYYPEQKEFIEEIMENLNKAGASIFASKDEIISPYLEKIQSLQRMKGLQARMPGELEIN